ncbi:MAG: hypothetical protein KDC45_00615, partial [Bacteroidetes bacterium]|nr:hypothetical protein [Bacteroidota bacterium]
MKRTNVLLAVLLAWAGSSLAAQTLDARFSSSVYSWENQFIDSSTSGSFKAYQTAMFHAYGVGTPELSVHGYLRTSHDFGTETNNNPEYRIYNLYAQWYRKTDDYRFETRVGRQAIAGAVRFVTADAVRLDYAAGDQYSVMAFFGSLPPADGTVKTLNPFAGHALGARVQSSKYLHTHAALSFFDKSREGQYYVYN